MYKIIIGTISHMRDILQSTLHVSSHTSAFPQLWFVLDWEACKMQYPKDLSNWLSQDTLRETTPHVGSFFHLKSLKHFYNTRAL